METMVGEKMKKNTRQWKKAGVIGVDSGNIIIHDPCYEGSQKQITFNGCMKVLTKAGKGNLNKAPDYIQLKYNKGHPGAGVMTRTGFGDGVYPVYVEIVNDKDFGKRIGRVLIDFELQIES